jgi:hypothetical protein
MAALRRSTVLLAFLLACAAVAGAEDIAVSVASSTAGRITVDARIIEADTARLLRSLRDGLESTVTFEVRLYRKAIGLRGLLGDPLVDHVDVTRRASVDFLDDRYILVDEAGTTRLLTDLEDFLREFLTLAALPLTPPAGGQAYVYARARLEYVKLDPPLHIVALFRPTAAVTRWCRVDLRGPEGTTR